MITATSVVQHIRMEEDHIAAYPEAEVGGMEAITEAVGTQEREVLHM